MKHSAAVRIGVPNCQGLSLAKVTNGRIKPAQWQLRFRVDAAADVSATAAGLHGLRPPVPPATSLISNNIVPLGHGQAERTVNALDGSAAEARDKLKVESREGAVPEHVASARAWIAAWKAKQENSKVPDVPENVATARAWISAWKAKAQASDATEVEALRLNVEKLRGLLSAAQAELSCTATNRDLLALSLAREVFEAAAQRKQLDTALSALDNEKAHVQVLLGQQQKAEFQAALQRDGGAAAAEQLLKLSYGDAALQPAAGGFTNTNRFWVPNHLEPRFLKAVAERQAAMQKFEGFLGLAVREFSDPNHPVEEFVLEVSSSWATVAAWEAWSGGREVQRHSLPNGIMQFPPKRGEGFPEDYVPFKDLAAEVPNAKY